VQRGWAIKVVPVTRNGLPARWAWPVFEVRPSDVTARRSQVTPNGGVTSRLRAPIRPAAMPA
jgi:hypothetical protein